MSTNQTPGQIAAQIEAIANAEAHLNNACLALAIYTVTCVIVHNGRRRMEMHHVAGFSSDDAERRMKEHSAPHLGGDCYITTDDAIASRPDACISRYITGWRKTEDMSDDEYRRWVHSTTEPSTFDGQTEGPTLRRFDPAA